MRKVKEPTYKKYITGELVRFDERNTGFSRGAVEADKYTLMHKRSVENIAKQIPGKTILDHARWVSGRTVDYLLRKNALARETSPIYNKKYRLKDPDPQAMSRIIKEAALWIGADLVGIAKLNPLWIYTHWGLHNAMYTNAAGDGDPIEIPPEYKMVIVLASEMHYEGMRYTPNVEAETDIGYSKAAWCASSLATFIAELGFKAIPAVNELGISIPMAVDAGLGEMGRSGQLITREFGPRVRISKVFTDLPLIPDSPVDIGVQKFCEKCKLCAKYCPSRALMTGERTDKAWDVSNSPGMLKWPIHAMKCFDWWVKNGTHCSVCVRVCPWNKPNNFLHRMVRVFAERNILTPFIVFMDQFLGYGKQAKPVRVQDPSVVEK
ncbi:MAG: reductive dehalogenase [Deltaproteobacteria bacterium]|nr:reductive dehalogenase [Deltaproteobacteria bacterium]MBW1976725.1 reductive dehalogenase [Deltaproteobacteria bacterium]MBW2045715.1 reductive dehalogenase [Deltaproteobacteria bacterium]MBW2299154.1 reductive dehalogenase [Deltaproteobacteria bacterium]